MRKLHRMLTATFLIYLAAWVGWHLVMIWRYEAIMIYEGSKLVLGLELFSMAIAISFGIIEVMLVLKERGK